MQIIIFTAILASAVAAPAYVLSEAAHVVHTVPLTKSTITRSSQIVDHGSTFIHTPVVPVVHGSTKTTVTKSSQLVNHGGTALVHAPVVHAAVVHAPIVHAPVLHATISHEPVYVHSSPIVSVKTGASAISHQSSTVHETVPLFSVHH